MLLKRCFEQCNFNLAHPGFPAGFHLLGGSWRTLGGSSLGVGGGGGSGWLKIKSVQILRGSNWFFFFGGGGGVPPQNGPAGNPGIYPNQPKIKPHLNFSKLQLCVSHCTTSATRWHPRAPYRNYILPCFGRGHQSVTWPTDPEVSANFRTPPPHLSEATTPYNDMHVYIISSSSSIVYLTWVWWIIYFH